ncbi:DUF7285 family protein [Halosegnis marinus]|uniref:PASTA domain-containing protein n=1 Tax=Halosegnis marinus TaxID=3034023 RepID=A0ABD5ZR30_9EURY|nr:hypothetical protein [Halosegnis sp. DT85]
MSRSSDRAQAEPLAALVAVAAVCLALSAYAGVVDDVLPREGPSPEARLDAVADDLAPAGVVPPARVDSIPLPEGTNVSLAVGNRSWTRGPTPPRVAASARRRVPVRVGPGRVVPGRLRVSVW